MPVGMFRGTTTLPLRQGGWVTSFCRGARRTGAGLVVMVSLQAATVYQSFTGNLQTGDNLPQQGLDQVSLNIPRFDPSLGTLTAVQFDLSSSFRSSVTFYHPSANGLTFTYTPRNYVGVEFPGLSTPPPLRVDHPLSPLSYTDTTPWGGSLWQPTARDSATDTQVVNNPAELPAYVGLNYFQAILTIEDRCVYLSSNPLTYINDKYLSSDFTFTIRYEYLPVPEPPAGWVAEATVCFVAGWARVRRMRSRPAISPAEPRGQL